MKGQLGIFQNANALLIDMDVTNKDLLMASRLEGNLLQVRTQETKDAPMRTVFELRSGCTTNLTSTAAIFPIGSNAQKVRVLFMLQGTDAKELRYAAAQVQAHLITIEKQVIAGLKKMEDVANTITVLGGE